MTHPVIYLEALAIASLFTWCPGNLLLNIIWELIANRERVDPGRPIPLVQSVGGLERILYLMGVIGHHYELIAGWLVLKAFFTFMDRDQTIDAAGTTPDDTARLVRYNGLLLGNALSLLIGISVGVLANLFIRWRIGIALNWAL